MRISISALIDAGRIQHSNTTATRRAHGLTQQSSQELIDSRSIASVRTQLEKVGIQTRIIVDCSHANSGKDPLRQPEVLNNILEQQLHDNQSIDRHVEAICLKGVSH
ncbi:hypothetical protein ACVBEG_26975 [Pseudomonas sp. GG8]